MPAISQRMPTELYVTRRPGRLLAACTLALVLHASSSAVTAERPHGHPAASLPAHFQFRIRSQDPEERVGYATDLALGPDGDVYVADSGNGRISVFDQRGDFQRTWGTPGLDEGQLSGQFSVAVARDGTVWASRSDGQIQAFSASGRLIRGWLTSPCPSAPPALPPIWQELAAMPYGTVLVADYHGRHMWTISPDDWLGTGPRRSAVMDIGSDDDQRIRMELLPRDLPSTAQLDWGLFKPLRALFLPMAGAGR